MMHTDRWGRPCSRDGYDEFGMKTSIPRNEIGIPIRWLKKDKDGNDEYGNNVAECHPCLANDTNEDNPDLNDNNQTISGILTHSDQFELINGSMISVPWWKSSKLIAKDLQRDTDSYVQGARNMFRAGLTVGSTEEDKDQNRHIPFINRIFRAYQAPNIDGKFEAMIDDVLKIYNAYFPLDGSNVKILPDYSIAKRLQVFFDKFITLKLATLSAVSFTDDEKKGLPADKTDGITTNIITRNLKSCLVYRLGCPEFREELKERIIWLLRFFEKNIDEEERVFCQGLIKKIDDVGKTKYLPRLVDSGPTAGIQLDGQVIVHYAVGIGHFMQRFLKDDQRMVFVRYTYVAGNERLCVFVDKNGVTVEDRTAEELEAMQSSGQYSRIVHIVNPHGGHWNVTAYAPDKETVRYDSSGYQFSNMCGTHSMCNVFFDSLNWALKTNPITDHSGNYKELRDPTDAQARSSTFGMHYLETSAKLFTTITGLSTLNLINTTSQGARYNFADASLDVYSLLVLYFDIGSTLCSINEKIDILKADTSKTEELKAWNNLLEAFLEIQNDIMQNTAIEEIINRRASADVATGYFNKMEKEDPQVYLDPKYQDSVSRYLVYFSHNRVYKELCEYYGVNIAPNKIKVQEYRTRSYTPPPRDSEPQKGTKFRDFNKSDPKSNVATPDDPDLKNKDNTGNAAVNDKDPHAQDAGNVNPKPDEKNPANDNGVKNNTAGQKLDFDNNSSGVDLIGYGSAALLGAMMCCFRKAIQTKLDVSRNQLFLVIMIASSSFGVLCRTVASLIMSWDEPAQPEQIPHTSSIRHSSVPVSQAIPV